jgi:hypothetical protein
MMKPVSVDEAERIRKFRRMLEPHVQAAVDALVLCMGDDCDSWTTRERAAARVLEFYSTAIGLAASQEKEVTQILVVKSEDIAVAAGRAAELHQARMAAAKAAEREQDN